MFTTQLKSQVYATFKKGITAATRRTSNLLVVKNTTQLQAQNQLLMEQQQEVSQLGFQPQLAFAHSNKPRFVNQTYAEKANQRTTQLNLLENILGQQYILKSEGGDKPPKGFEKFFKKKEEREKESSTPKEKEDNTKSSSDKEEKKAASSTKKEEEEQISEEESDSKGSSNGDGGKKGGENKDDGGSKWRKFLFDEDNQPKPEGFLALMLSGFAGYYLLTYRKPMQEIVYMDFLNNYLLKNNVKEINITKDRRTEVFNYRAEVVTQSGEKFYMVLGSYESFLAKLDMVQREMGRSPAEFVPVKYQNQSEEGAGTFMMNMLIGSLFVLFFYQIYKAGRGGKPLGGKGTGGAKGTDANKDKGSWFQGGKGGGLNDMFNFGKSNVTVFGDDKKIKTRFKDVAGNENAKIEIMEFVDFLKDPKKYQKLGARVPRGALLVGPPGCGKTLLAKAVAGEAKVPFLTISGSDFVEMFVGVGASRVRDLFKKAREKAPSIIFIDEIDAVGKKRHGKMGGGNDERDNTLNQLLVEMDGFTTDTSVIVLAATNRQDILDSALLRPGRFDRMIEITLPSIKERDQIFNVHLKKIKLNEKMPKEDYARKMSALTPGFSGADLKNICNEAAIIAARKNLTTVSIKEFEEATERVIGGIEKKLPLSDLERRTVAFHEAGHAVAGWFLQYSAPLLKVTIIPRAKGALGFAQYLPDELSLYSREQLEDMMVMALGGRVAEEIFFNRITTGASDDIKKVTQIAAGLVTQYGMSPKLGCINYSPEEGYQKSFSEETGAIIDEEVRLIIDQAYNRCKALLLEKKDLMQKLGDTLLQKETLALPDIVDCLGQRPYPLKESLLEYLEELRERKVEEEKAAETPSSQAADPSSDSNPTEQQQGSNTSAASNTDASTTVNKDSEKKDDENLKQ